MWNSKSCVQRSTVHREQQSQRPPQPVVNSQPWIYSSFCKYSLFRVWLWEPSSILESFSGRWKTLMSPSRYPAQCHPKFISTFRKPGSSQNLSWESMVCILYTFTPWKRFTSPRFYRKVGCQWVDMDLHCRPRLPECYILSWKCDG